MNTEKELTEKILLVTNTIRDKHPELLTFLNEMTVTIPDEKNPEMNVKVLQEYYDSINTILQKYLLEQTNNLEEK